MGITHDAHRKELDGGGGFLVPGVLPNTPCQGSATEMRPRGKGLPLQDTSSLLSLVDKKDLEEGTTFCSLRY